MDPVTLSVGVQTGESSAQGQALASMADAVSKRTDGKVTLDLYYWGSLHVNDEQLTAIATGVANLGAITPQYNPQELPLSGLALSFGALPSPTWPFGNITATLATQDLFAASPELVSEYEAHNIKVLTSGYLGPLQLTCNKPLKEGAGAHRRWPDGA